MVVPDQLRSILAGNRRSVLTKNQEKLIRSLSLRKNRKKTGLFVAEGMKLVTDFLSAGLKPENIFVLEEALTAFENQISVSEVSIAEMKRLSFLETPSSVFGVFHIPAIEEFNLVDDFVLVLDRIQDPGNLGTLLRTAVWYGIRQVVVLSGTVDPYSPKVVQSAMAAHPYVTLLPMEEESFTSWAADQGLTGVCAHMEGTAARSFDWPQKTALILGNEGQGVSPTLMHWAERTVTLPGDSSKMESLNVAVSGVTLMYEYVSKVGL
jgi:TrmH family RNA methyltransferase